MKRWSFVEYATGEEELYALRRDPYQLHNLAGLPSEASRVAAMKQQLRTFCQPLPPGMAPF